MDNFERTSAKLALEKFVYSSEWIPDEEIRASEREKERLQEELDVLSGKKKHPAECKGCKANDSYACIECPKRTFGLDYVPDQYYVWTTNEKIEWKQRMTGETNGSVRTEGNLQDYQSTTEAKE